MSKISVIVPIYKVEIYIERCARSLFEQTLDDIEYIFVDDCSPDNSVEILRTVLEDYPNRKPQVRLIRLETNGGLPNARHQGFQFASGAYIIHCDSDDYVDRGMYEMMYEKARRTDSDIVTVDFYNDNEGKLSVVKSNSCTDKQIFIAGMLEGKINCAVWNKMVRHKLYDDVIIWPERNNNEDLVLCVQLVNNAERITTICEPYYYYVTRGGSISRDVTVSNAIRNAEDAKENLTLVEKCIPVEEYRESLLRRKWINRGWLLTCPYEKKVWKLYRNFYPGLDAEIFRSVNISVFHKAMVIAYGVNLTCRLCLWLKTKWKK